MKHGVRIALALGLVVMIALIAREGVGTITTLLSRAGWILILLVPLQAFPLLLDVLDAKLRETFAAHERILQALCWQFAGNGSKGEESH
ncbi:MAG TPA: hypothetical protein VGL34_09320 [Steroidobacteraceae bacterium]|jgi:hypothetical protein